MIKKIKLREEVDIYRRFLINLHTARWTGNDLSFAILMNKLAEYSYSRTNSNGYYKEEEQNERRTLLALNDWLEEYKVKKEEDIKKKKEEYNEKVKNDPEFAALVEKFSKFKKHEE